MSKDSVFQLDEPQKLFRRLELAQHSAESIGIADVLIDAMVAYSCQSARQSAWNKTADLQPRFLQTRLAALSI